MPITSSAIKAVRASKKKRVFNLRRKAIIDKNIKSFKRFISLKNKAEAEKIIPTIYQSLDKAAKTGYIKPNTAGRIKSRIMASLNKLG